MAKKSRQRRPAGASADVAEILGMELFPNSMRRSRPFRFSEGPLCAIKDNPPLGIAGNRLLLAELLPIGRGSTSRRRESL